MMVTRACWEPGTALVTLAVLWGRQSSSPPLTPHTHKPGDSGLESEKAGLDLKGREEAGRLRSELSHLIPEAPCEAACSWVTSVFLIVLDKQKRQFEFFTFIKLGGHMVTKHLWVLHPNRLSVIFSLRNMSG